jgi:protein MBA1
VQEVVLNTSVRWSSKPGIFKRPALKYKKSTLVPTAKALHRSMLQALATGDRLAINKTCARKLGVSLLVNIDARPRGRRYSWELVEYTNKLFYPTIKSHKLSPLGRERDAPILRQMIVAISSKQRKGVYDVEGRVIPGSEKEMDVVEHVAVSCVIDPKNGYAQQDWRVIGTTTPTTLGSWAKDKEIMKMILQQ